MIDRVPCAATLLALLLSTAAAPATAAVSCARTITANVVALDQVFSYNRLGAFNPAGMIYALKRDVVDDAGLPLSAGGAAIPGHVRLRADKRPRPLVLRANVGDCLEIHFTNLLAPSPLDNQPATRSASVHVIGLPLVGGIDSDGSNVGKNNSSLVTPGQAATYTLYAEREGGYLLYSTAATTGGEGNGAGLALGLFGAVNVEPAGSEWYRSQLNEEEMRLASTGSMGDGHPQINYGALYPAGSPWSQEGKSGLPIVNMLSGSEIVHSDLNAVITGPNRGNLIYDYPANPVSEPNKTVAQAPGAKASRPREEPFREFTVIFHDEIKAIQAFNALYEDPVLSHTLHSVRDGFAINYGVGGAGSEVLANRLGVGPMKDCNECKYEEFFLTSWAVGDPAMVVDVPASEGLYEMTPAQANDHSPSGFIASHSALFGAKATKAFYPDDPSNVHHSYLGDHVKFRNIHAGPKEHHIFHLHAHQWLYTPDSDGSAYMDSQAVGPGSHYNYEITYNGSGNRNQTVGDSIFHCHFYPHFAQGMWALWRVHDTFEAGTRLEVSGGSFHTAPYELADGKPAAQSRALPDNEIKSGTPIPALVPIPTLAMAPMPAVVSIDPATGQIKENDLAAAVAAHKNPGYPFFIPGVAGHRPPHPPLDTLFDGGLPRHVVLGGESLAPPLGPLDMSKESETLQVAWLPEVGTAIEDVAMDFHELRVHDSFTPEGSALKFVTNGRPRAPGAPYADPCVNDQGAGVGTPRTYKGAHIQLDMKLNKLGWHFPQSRMLSLFQDVAAFVNGTKAPEPLFFRANSGDCITYQLANLLPKEYKLDDFQVRTPTDITGQHIHLVKFDVTASDGAGNGWNYEDAGFAPQEVRERINAINAYNATHNPAATPLSPTTSSEFSGLAVTDAEGQPLALGAQIIAQRWYADSVVGNSGYDRTLRTVYTHDHYGPSTHQQAGLYAGLVIEPTGSTWKDSETGVTLGSRGDGGPTSWRADIHTNPSSNSYREFLLEMSDFQPAYKAGAGGTWQNPVPDPVNVINPPAKEETNPQLPLLVEKLAECPGGGQPPCPEAISAADTGTFTVNYRNEPLALRILQNANCGITGATTTSCAQASGTAGDLSFALRSDVTRPITALNSQPSFYPARAGALPGDPFTPLLRAYKNDKIQIRTLVGGQEEGHITTIHGIKWLDQPNDPNSGWRNAKMNGISEHFEFLGSIVPTETGVTAAQFQDYLYTVDSSTDGFWNGVWGIMRAYDKAQTDLKQLPNNAVPASGSYQSKVTNASSFNGVCPVGANLRSYMVYALAANTALPQVTALGGQRSLVYNNRVGNFPGHPGPLHDPYALVLALEEDVEVVQVGSSYQYRLKSNAPIEPLILRAAAGDCVEVTLRNTLPTSLTDPDAHNLAPMIVEGFNLNEVNTSVNVGLHPQLLAFDVGRYNGVNVGKNQYATQTAGPNRAFKYRWYAGHLAVNGSNQLVATPVEFGATNLMPAEPIKHSHKGLIGALIVEPYGSTWVTDTSTRTAATVTKPNNAGSFRDLVVLMQDDIQLRDATGFPIPSLVSDDAEDSGNKAVNYRSEPLWFRRGYTPARAFELNNDEELSDVLHNSITGNNDPQTPVFTAIRGQEVRFRVLQPGGHPRNHAFQVHGHAWSEAPYVASGSVGSAAIGTNPTSEWYGAQAGHGPANHFNMVLGQAGGPEGAVGDYLFRDQASFGFDAGIWGILRVNP
ncbi:hypothetical protein [Methyloterricola oryzae]|uniref:hypothetical protein n=1 Tax=Methyloterricola oryzae TaxID=1495050 RepID=UPI00069BF030|nr:hypothetical protein [Methyloterricola oryzae]